MRATRPTRFLSEIASEIAANLRGIRNGLASVSAPEKGIKRIVGRTEELTIWECEIEEDTVDDWQIITDAIIGGKSKCSLKFAPPKEDAPLGSAIFSGVLDSDIAGAQGNVIKSGFCAARYRLPPQDDDLGQYEGLAMRVKGDGRTYTVNVQCDTWFEDDLYQGFIVTPADEWVTVELPFNQFLLTSGGYVRTEQRKFNPETLETIAFCLTSSKAPVVGVGLRLPGALGAAAADDKEVESKFPGDGPFGIEVQWMKAVSVNPKNAQTPNKLRRLINCAAS
jgi:hypothetical protein